MSIKIISWKYDIPDSTGAGDLDGYPLIPGVLIEDHRLTIAGDTIDANGVSNFYIDEFGIKHIGAYVNTWQLIACSLHQPIIYDLDLDAWRIKNVSDYDKEIISEAINTINDYSSKLIDWSLYGTFEFTQKIQMYREFVATDYAAHIDPLNFITFEANNVGMTEQEFVDSNLVTFIKMEKLASYISFVKQQIAIDVPLAITVEEKKTTAGTFVSDLIDAIDTMLTNDMIKVIK